MAADVPAPVEQAFRQIEQSSTPLINLALGEGAPFVFIHGMSPGKTPEAWVKPLDWALQQNRPVYFFKWDNDRSIPAISDTFAEALKMVMADHSQNITLIGHSVGGVIAYLAFEQLPPELQQRVDLHTVASPFNGYGAPGFFAFLTTLGWGRAAGDTAGGMLPHHEGPLPALACHRWVTTNCRLDKHACSKFNQFPQTGDADGTTPMPCPLGEVTYLDHDTHSSAVFTVFQELFGAK